VGYDVVVVGGVEEPMCVVVGDNVEFRLGLMVVWVRCLLVWGLRLDVVYVHMMVGEIVVCFVFWVFLRCVLLVVRLLVLILL